MTDQLAALLREADAAWIAHRDADLSVAPPESSYDHAARFLPASGERPEFGRHRLPEAEAETAPAWPTLERFASAVWKQTVKRSGGR